MLFRRLLVPVSDVSESIDRVGCHCSITFSLFDSHAPVINITSSHNVQYDRSRPCCFNAMLKIATEFCILHPPACTRNVLGGGKRLLQPDQAPLLTEVMTFDRFTSYIYVCCMLSEHRIMFRNLGPIRTAARPHLFRTGFT